MDAANSQPNRGRMPYHTPTLKAFGKLAEDDFKLLAELERTADLSPEEIGREGQARLDHLVDLGLISIRSDPQQGAIYQIAEWGRKVLVFPRGIESQA